MCEAKVSHNPVADGALSYELNMKKGLIRNEDSDYKMFSHSNIS